MEFLYKKDSETIFLTAVLLVAAVVTQDVSPDCASCIKVNATCYNVSYLFDMNATFRTHIVVHKMGILRSENVLFYSFEPEIADKEYYKVGFVNLDNPDVQGVISDEHIKVLNFGTFDIDQDNSIVYLGGYDGIFTYGNTKKLAPYSSRGDTILSLFYKGFVYFVKSDDNRIISKKGDQFNSVLDYVPIKNFVLTKYDVIVFLSNYGLFLHKKGETIWLSKNAFFRGLTIDLDDTVYAWWIDGLYRVVIEKNLAESSIVKVAHIPGIGALTFDNDNNIIFNLDKSVFKMTETNVTKC
ncbi:ommochrome-binding protein-like [Galleria mellonella]|uniref:Ommochrome-binding protein-like n=1 Tax=Galleria mellonella TaxID=7137 RepID=A0A6J3BYU4_GALME|nr:ommochrome-binding protein-like [Galleria mellonella]